MKLVAKLYLDEEGMWWAYFWGDHMQQGGTAFSVGNYGGEDLKVLLSIVGRNLAKNKDKLQPKQEQKKES